MKYTYRFVDCDSGASLHGLGDNEMQAAHDVALRCAAKALLEGKCALLRGPSGTVYRNKFSLMTSVEQEPKEGDLDV